MNIRKAGLNDLEAISELIISLALEYRNEVLDLDVVRKGALHLLEHPTEGGYYISETASEITGYIMFFLEWSDWNGGDYYYIQAAYTKPNYRRQGIFKGLFQAVYEEAKGQKTALRAVINKSNPEIIQSLIQLGMNESNYKLFELVFNENKVLKED